LGTGERAKEGCRSLTVTIQDHRIHRISSVLTTRGKTRAALRAGLFRQIGVGKSLKISDLPAIFRLDLTENSSLSHAADFRHGLLKDPHPIGVYNTHMNSREVLRRLQEDGWYPVGQKGSHLQLKHLSKPGRVTVPHPKKDLPKGTLASIERQAGLKLR